MKAARFTLAPSWSGGLAPCAAGAETSCPRCARRIRSRTSPGRAADAAMRASTGVTPIVMEAISWLGEARCIPGSCRAELRQQAYDLAQAALTTRGVDDEPRLPTALGASIEVCRRPARNAVARPRPWRSFQGELNRWGDSIARRIQKTSTWSVSKACGPSLDFTEQSARLCRLSPCGEVVLLFSGALCGDCKTQAPVLARLLGATAAGSGSSRHPTLRLRAGRQAYAEYERGTSTRSCGRHAPCRRRRFPWRRQHGALRRSTILPSCWSRSWRMVRLSNPGRMTEEALDPIVRRLLN